MGTKLGYAALGLLSGLLLAGAVCVAVSAVRHSRRSGAETVTATTVTADTVTVHDTVRIIQPKEVRKTVVNTVYLPAADTLRIHDTLYVALEREAVRYSDSTYTAYVSGIRPRLDSIFVYPETRYINTMVETVWTQKPKRWGVGVTAGYGISTQGFVPYIGIGLSYNLITF